MNEQAIRAAYTPKEVALLYGLSPGTLANWRTKRVGPKFYKLHKRKVLYFREDLDAWARANPVQTIDSI